MIYTVNDLIEFNTNNYSTIGSFNPYFVTEEDFLKSETEEVLKKLLSCVPNVNFNLFDLTSGSRLYSKKILSVFKEKIDNVFLSDKFDFYSDYGKKDNVFKYDILSDDFSEIVDKNINNFIVFLNPYISSKNNEHYAIQPNVIKNNKKIKEQLKKCVQILKDKDKKFIFIFNSTKTDVYLEILKELLNTKDITPDILKINGLSLYGKEEGYLFLTNILVGCYGTKENQKRTQSIKSINKKEINLIKDREEIYSFVEKIILNK